MRRKTLGSLFLIFCLPLLMLAQTASPTPPADSQKTDDDEVIRVNSQLVLVDALVLDQNGKQVTDLKAEDFEVLQDGKPQKITNFGYYANGQNQIAAQTQPKNKNDKTALPLPPVSVRSNQGRVITFVIDDGNCLSTPLGLETARDAMKKFLSEQMQPDDKVAIYRTRGGSSLLQMYTSNREALRRVVDKVSWFPSGCGSAFEDYNSDIKIDRKSPNTEGVVFTNGQEEANLRQRNNQVLGTIDVLGFVVDRLKNLPQRKIVFFLSEGIYAKFDSVAFEALREISDKAARASVVIYTMSEKGLTIPGEVRASDNVRPDDIETVRSDRVDEETILNNGLAFLAYTTGGKFIRGKNFLDADIRKILDAEKGYYLLGYEPEEGTFKGKEFHKIEVRLKRADLTVSSRKGFIGREESQTRPKYKSDNSPLYQAISSPFQENGMDIRLTTLVEGGAAEKNVVRALFHVKGRDLFLTDESDGAKKVVLDVVAVLLDEKGKVIEEFNRTYPIRIPKQGVQTVLQNGLDFSTDIAVKKPGFYSLRLAVRDAGSKRLGSAGDFVEIPDLKKGNFLMTGLVTSGVTTEGKPFVPKTRTAETAFAPVFLNSVPSIRQYYAGSVLSYMYGLYNVKTDAAKQTKLTKRIRLYKDGKLLTDTGEKPLEIDAAQTGKAFIQDYGLMRLNQQAAPGEYILQVIIRDALANKSASQWIDFEIVK
jgi:VWFA-related protein